MIKSRTAKCIIAGILSILVTFSGLMPGYVGGVNASGNGDAFTASVGDALEIENRFDVEEESDMELVSESELGINFAVVEDSYIETPSYGKYIVIDMGDGSVNIEDAVLTVLNEDTNQEMKLKADTIMDTSLLFYADFPDESYTGKYLISSIDYTADGEEYKEYFYDNKMLPRFGVNTVITEEPNAWIVDEDDSTVAETESVRDIAENNASVMDLSKSFRTGDAIGVNGFNSDITISTGKKLAGEISEEVSYRMGTTADSEKIVVVLDPGHGGNDSGVCGPSTTWDGVTYCERDINLKIAFACKAELEKNASITVYMTRTDNVDNSMDDLGVRCKFAYDRAADLFVSLHCNSAVATAKGVEVYIPNTNYNTKVRTVGEEAGKAILVKLVNLGLTSRGYKIRNSENGTKYPDKSLADYYGVIKRCKEYGIPAIIVEHGFLTNKSDCQKFFSTDAKIAALGVADAQGIIACIETIKNNRSGGTGLKGWVTSGDKKMYYDENGTLKTGLFTVDGKTYYAGADGYILTGLRTIDNNKYYFETDGAMLKSAWKKVDKTKYYFTDTGAMAKGWLVINGKRYYFKSNGKRYSKGWRTIGTKKYYFNKGGYVATKKWMWDNGSKFYLGSKGAAVTGLKEIKGNTYYFSKYGVMQYGWIKDGKKKYYMSWSNGKALKGWHSIWGVEYYFGKKGAMQTGFTKIGKKTYYLLKDGGYKTGWNKISKKMYYFNWKGVMQTGWTTYNYNKAYLKTDNGALAKKEFVTLKNGKTYYFDKKYAMQTGLKTISKEKYYFSSKGVLSKSKWVTQDGQKYYATADGKLAHDSWQTIDGKTYYFGSNNKYVTGSQTIGGVAYIFDATGVLTDGTAPVTTEKTTESTTEKATEEKKEELYTIMGTSSITVDDMVKYYNSSGATYPAASLKKGGAADIKTFCTILKEEAEAEGVKAEVLYAQVMLETGWLKFGGQVKISQYNFGGLGATDGGAAGASFKDIRTGLRAQTQHLKAYACTDDLKNTCVDPRFKLVTRGCAKYVEYLGIKENPDGKGWATAEKYGYHIVELIKKIK